MWPNMYPKAQSKAEGSGELVVISMAWKRGAKLAFTCQERGRKGPKTLDFQ